MGFWMCLFVCPLWKPRMLKTPMEEACVCKTAWGIAVSEVDRADLGSVSQSTKPHTTKTETN